MSNDFPRPSHCSIRYGNFQFDVTIAYRDVGRLTIHVYPDQTVSAVVPANQPWKKAHARLTARAAWVHRQVCYFEQFKPLPIAKKYVSGETVLYLGRQYRLRVKKGVVPSTRLLGRYLVVELPETTRDRVQESVERWYRHRARAVLTARLKICCQMTATLQLAVPEMRLRKMRTRWGSCTASGMVALHPHLVMLPAQCIEYVVIHELCHRKVLRHDPRFYALLTRYLPDWKARKARLDGFVIDVG